MEAEQVLENEERHCQELIDSLPQAIWTCEPDGRCDYANRYVEQFTGVPVARLLGWGWADCLHPEDRDRVKAAWMTAIKTGNAFDLDYRVRDREGRYHWAKAHGIPVRDADGRIVKWIGLVVEIDERKRMEVALRLSEEFNRHIVESSMDCIKILDLEGRLLSINQAGQQFLEIDDLKPHLGRPVTDLWGPETRPKLTEAIAQARAGGVGTFQGLFTTSSGKVKGVDVLVTPIRDSEGRPERLLAVSRDITKLKHIEEELRRCEQECQHQFTWLETIYASAPVGLAFLDANLRYVNINERLAAINGRPAADHLGRTLREMVPKLADVLEPAYRRAISTGEPVLNMEVQGTTPAAPEVIHDWLTSCYPVRSDDGTVLGVNLVVQDITERKEMEQALRENEERFRLVAEAAGAMVFDISIDYCRIDPAHGLPHSDVIAVHGLAELLGYQPHETPMTVDWWISQIHPADLPAHLSRIVERFRTRHNYTAQYRIRHKGGHYIAVESIVRMMRDDQGNVVRLVGGIRDITQQRTMEETLRQQEERFRLVAEAAGQLVFDIGINLNKRDPVYQFPEIEINAVHGLPELLGFSPDEVPLSLQWMIGQIHPDDAPEFIKRSLQGFVELKDLTLHYRIRHKDGHYLNVEEISRIVRDTNGRPVRLVGGIRDRTEQLTMEAALAESEEKFRSLAENANTPIGIIQGRKFVYANPYLVRLSGYTPEEFFALDILQLVHPDFRAMIADRYARRIAGDPSVPSRYEYKMITKNGEERWIDVAPVHIDLKGIPSIIGNSIDVTESKRNADALGKANEELEARVRERTAQLQETVEELKRSNEDLEQFAYICSHDLQEPLRMIGSYVGLLAVNYKERLDDDAREFIGYAEEGAVRMSRLIKDLLEYSRVNTQGQKPVPTDAGAVVRQVLSTLRLKIEEAGAQVTVGDLPTVQADTLQLGQIFQNLIDNALKYSKENEPPRIHVGAQREDSQWVFSVRDNGIGIESRHREQIFVAFKRLQADRQRYPGTGIGLALVKRIVERHGGSVYVDSEPGEGSTFYFTLPAHEPGKEQE